MLQSVSLRVITPVVWLEAPDWLTLEEASYLSGHDLDTVRWLANDGAFDLRDDGLIDRASLREFQEALLEVLWLTSTPPSGLQPRKRQAC
jgi:hypothetical protein